VEDHVGERTSLVPAYPRIVGETGGKDFIVAHPSADPQALAVAIVRGAFEYQGQKCSAASRVYVPKSLWPQVKRARLADDGEIKMGDVADFRNFMGAVIDRKAPSRRSRATSSTRSKHAKVVFGRRTNDDDASATSSSPPSCRPTIPATADVRGDLRAGAHALRLPRREVAETLRPRGQTSPYALTGAIFAQDRARCREAHGALRNAAGNFYINDKPTGAVVGQQPFGGARASGTNDKAGSKLNLMRWAPSRSSGARTIKETFVPPTDSAGSGRCGRR
jgi:1-pyrroline-5-carboxylate dehydrogenase